MRRVSRRFDIFRSAARPRAALEYFGLRQFIAALISHHLSCRFCIFPIASSPPPVFDFITLSCRFGSAVRLNEVKQVPLWLRQRTLPAHVNEEISSYIAYAIHTWKISEYVIHSYPELAFGEPKRDSRPALPKCIPMMSCVSGSEETFVAYVGGFHFIFPAHSHDNEKAAKLQ